MTKKKREQLSNRLVLNFGILLLGALIMLYVNSAIKTYSVANIAYIVILILGILGLASAVFLFVYGKQKKPQVKNYSAVGLGVFIASVVIYASKLNLYSKNIAVIAVYLLMLIYFIILAVYTSVMIRKPLEKDPAAEAVKKNKKKKRK